MAVSKKGKRKLVYNDREFYWYFKMTDPDLTLHVISDDKKFIVSYQRPYENKDPFVVINGKEFKGIKDTGSCSIRVLAPNWKDDQITPGFVRKLIIWCLEEDKEITLVNYLGQRIENTNST